MTTTFALQFLGLFFLVISLAGIARTQNFIKVTEEITQSHSSTFLVSIMRVIVGLVFTLQPDLWAHTPGNIAGFIGAIILVSGVFGLVFPGEIMRILPAWIKSPRRVRAWFFVGLTAGTALAMLGFGLLPL